MVQLWARHPNILLSTDLNLYSPLPGKSDHSQPQNMKWENVDDTPLGNIETDQFYWRFYVPIIHMLISVLALLQTPEILVTHQDCTLVYFNCARCTSLLGANVVCTTISIVSNPSDEHSLRAILDNISTLAAGWFNLGVALGLFPDTLREIDSNHRGEGRRCLTEMVIAWLQMKDNSQPSWQSLASALSSPSVGRVEIATMIAAEHPSH